MATLRDVARAAGVSVSVASRVLNSDASLRARPDTRDRVLLHAERLDYRPSHAARALRLSQSKTVGLFLPYLTNPVVAEIMHGVEDRANDNGIQTLLGRIERLEKSGESLHRLIGEGRVDGLLVQLSDGFKVKTFEALTTYSTPVVLLQSRGSRPGSVTLDDETGARIATEHLLRLGHEDIGWLGGLPDSQSARRRRTGFQAAMQAAGLRPPPRRMTSLGYRADLGHTAALSLLGTGRSRPTALVSANINAAAGALAAARELGVHVPDELSIVAIHDTWIAEYLQPRLTTVRMPLYELGGEALDMLIGILSGKRRSDNVISEPAPQLIVRESTAGSRR
jgi:LacI family transcriptional regulator